MCKYCEYIDDKHYGEDMVDKQYSNDGATMTICDVFSSDEKFFEISIYGEGKGYTVSSIDINYCPICGRKL